MTRTVHNETLEGVEAIAAYLADVTWRGGPTWKRRTERDEASGRVIEGAETRAAAAFGFPAGDRVTRREVLLRAASALQSLSIDLARDSQRYAQMAECLKPTEFDIAQSK